MAKPAKFIARGITAEGRAKTYKRKGLWAIKKKNGGKLPVHPKKAKAAEAPAKTARFYPADDVPKPLSHRAVNKQTKLRPSITPGTVLILLAGRFKGKRCIFLGQLPSGLLLVTGPFKLNGVPVRRVNQAYVIATSAKVQLPKLDLTPFGTDAKSESAYFDPVEKKAKKDEKQFFTVADAKKKELSQQYIANIKTIDNAVLPALSADMKGYLSTRFTLRDGDRPHMMKF